MWAENTTNNMSGSHDNFSGNHKSHEHRSEHWVVVSGCATVWKDSDVFVLESNASVYIRAGQKHRLANEGDEPLIVIEVQTGSYLGEDDIVRYEDVYHRSE